VHTIDRCREERALAHILLVEDDLETREVLAEELCALGHKVRLAQNGDEGLHALTAAHPDCMILDVEMPSLDGVEMARLLAPDTRLRVPVVLFSGRPDLEDVAARVGTPYFLTKPSSVAVLAQLIETAIRRNA
jgi:two-component system nitrogen regulation response regulator NtrX